MGAKRKSLGGKNLTIAGNASELAPHENPLVRNETLKEMYQKMVELRLLEKHAPGETRRTKRAERDSTVGLEACWVGVLQGLMTSDVVTDCSKEGPTGHLLGTKPERATAAATRAEASTARVLPFLEDAEQRLFAAVGAGLMVKSSGQKSVVVVYVRANEVAKGVWLRVLKHCAELDLPIIFVVLPEDAKHGGKSSRVCGWAHKGGVPGIPVDASDAVALYRVAQESMGRVRGDGGPVLISCVSIRGESGKTRAGFDPIEQLKGFMLGRKVAPLTWMESVERRFKLKLN